MKPGRLQREIKKRRPFTSAAEELLLGLWRTHDRLQIRLARLFREFGLTPSQYNILRILRGEGKPLPILEVASRMVAVVPGITGLIDRLEALGLVARRRCAEDRRVIYVEITPRALELLAELDEPLQAVNDRLVGHLSQAQVKELIRLLEQLREPLGEAE